MSHTTISRITCVATAAVLAGGCSQIESSQWSDGAHVARSNEGNVVYTNLGHGDRAVVFVHGWSSDRSFWKYQMESPELRRTAGRLIAIDLIGHGESDKPQIKYSMDLFARSIATVLDDAGVKRAVLVGHSNGTPVVRQFYRLYPQRTEALVIVDGALKSFFDDPATAERFLAPLRAADYQAGAAKFIDNIIKPMKNDDDRQHVRAVMLATPQHVMVGAMEAAVDPAIWRDDQIDAPVLAIMAKSPFWTTEYEAYVHQLCPRLDYHVIDGVSHFLMMDKPDEFNALLVTFLRVHVR